VLLLAIGLVAGDWRRVAGEEALHEGLLGDGRKTGPSGPRPNASLHSDAPRIPSWSASSPSAPRSPRSLNAAVALEP
jgi:hypothetical protein